MLPIGLEDGVEQRLGQLPRALPAGWPAAPAAATSRSPDQRRLDRQLLVGARRFDEAVHLGRERLQLQRHRSVGVLSARAPRRRRRPAGRAALRGCRCRRPGCRRGHRGVTRSAARRPRCRTRRRDARAAPAWCRGSGSLYSSSSWRSMSITSCARVCPSSCSRSTCRCSSSSAGSTRAGRARPGPRRRGHRPSRPPRRRRPR